MLISIFSVPILKDVKQMEEQECSRAKEGEQGRGFQVRSKLIALQNL